MALEIEVDLYEYLGISIDSSSQEIKKAYKIKAKELHPDKNKDDPKAKERFQKLKEYCDILLDPVQKKQYDCKIKAKIAAAKRHSELTGERRRLREVLEAREREAAERRKKANEMAEKERVAARIRREWEEAQEAARRANVAQQKAEAEFLSKTRFPVVLKWDKSDDIFGYTRDFLMSCLREFGVVESLVARNRTALAEFSTWLAADSALKASKLGKIGYPDNPLKVSLPKGYQPPVFEACSPHTSSFTAKRAHSPSPLPTVEIPGNMSFESFEADILAKMTRFQ